MLWSPFCISLRSIPPTFTSQVPLAPWSPFGLSLASFRALSRSSFWFFPAAVLLFLLVRVTFRPSSGSFLGIFQLLQTSVSAVYLPLCCFLSALRPL